MTSELTYDVYRIFYFPLEGVRGLSEIPFRKTLPSRHREVKPTKEINLNDIEKLHVVKQYIDEHFLNDLTLTGLSREGMLNEFKLKKGFKALFGTSVIHYVRQLRMQHARTLLRDHRMTVEEVSSRVGYQYPNHFAVAFKKHFGILPSDR